MEQIVWALLRGLGITLAVSFLATVIWVPLGIALALGRMSSAWYVRLVAGAIVETFRGTSAIVQLFWAFYVLPFFGIELSPLTAAVLVLGINEASYASEVIRGSLVGVDRGQVEASKSLGLRPATTFKSIILPQSLVSMVAPLGNCLVDIVKFSALVSLVTVPDLTFRVQILRSNVGHTVLLYSALLLIYFALASLISFAVRRVESSIAWRYGTAAPPSRRKEQNPGHDTAEAIR